MTEQPVPPLPVAMKVGLCALGAGCFAAMWWVVSGHDFSVRPTPPIVTHYEMPEPSNDATTRALAIMRADPLTGATSRACLDAIDRANYASHHLGSEASIKASTDMLRACDTGR